MLGGNKNLDALLGLLSGSFSAKELANAAALAKISREREEGAAVDVEKIASGIRRREEEITWEVPLPIGTGGLNPKSMNLAQRVL